MKLELLRWNEITSGYIAILTTEQTDLLFLFNHALRLPNVCFFFVNDVSFSSENVPKLIIIVNKFARIAISKSYDSFYLHDAHTVYQLIANSYEAKSTKYQTNRTKPHK